MKIMRGASDWKSCLLRWFVPIAAMPLFSSIAVATDLNVSCGGSEATYHTITDALNSLIGALDGPHSITVTGTCNENVNIWGRKRIMIQAPIGATATITGPNPNSVVLAVQQSRSIGLRRLVIKGGSRGVMINDSSEVDMDQCTVEGTGGIGIQVSDLSNLQLNRATIHNNASAGLAVDDSSYATVGEMTFADQLIHIHDNGGTGISVTNSVVMVRGKATIENNAGTGISLLGSRFQLGGTLTEAIVRNNGGYGLNISNGSSATLSNISIYDNGGTGISISGSHLQLRGNPAQNLIRNNSGFGLNISNGSSATISGQNTIQGNWNIGVQVGRSSSASFETAGMPDDSVGYTTIEEHSQIGVNIAAGGNALFWGSHKIRGNGFEPESPETSPYRGGFRVATQGELALRNGPEVSNNTGQGIWVEVGASVALGYPAEPLGATISGNTKEGVLVTRNANLFIASPSTVADNGIANISCDRSAWVFGDVTGIKNIKCDNVLPDGKK